MIDRRFKGGDGRKESCEHSSELYALCIFFGGFVPTESATAQQQKITHRPRYVFVCFLAPTQPYKRFGASHMHIGEGTGANHA